MQQQGVQVAKAASNFLVVIAFVSKDGRMSGADLADYVAASVQDPISRVEGVGDTQLFGSQYAMRIWLDPNKLNAYKLTALDVSNAIKSKNVQVSAGQLGAQPAVPGQQLNATVTAQTRLKTADQFKAIVLKTQATGADVTLADVARVELGSESYGSTAVFNGKPAAGMAIKLAPNANALDTVKKINARLAELQPFYPEGMAAEMPYDTTPFVRTSIEDVIKTLVEAIVLVFLVMYLFLQNWRATLIPTIAVPIVLLGTFGVIAAFGFTINTLTMFALVLAIGLLVDDAIVVVENVERVMAEDGLSPLEATRKSMDEITGALVGIALVLAAVFVPMAFFSGSVGVIYRQFSITIVSAMVLSVLVALILTPALCATLLKPVAKGHETKRGFFGWFNRVFDRGNAKYRDGVASMVKHKAIVLVVYGVLAVAMAFGFSKLPAGFLPDEDQGTLFAIVTLPPGATQDRADKVLDQVRHTFLVDEKEAVSSVFTVAGFSFAGSGQNMGLVFVRLKPWGERSGDKLTASAVAGRSSAAFAKIVDARVFAFAPPAVSELGNASGFDLQLQDRGNVGHAVLLAARNQLLGAAANENGLVGVRPNGQEDTPQLDLAIDDKRAGVLGLTLADINTNLSATWGSAYVNDFIDKGRVKKVFLQADAPFRMLPEDIDRWFVRNGAGDMVPFSAFSTASWSVGSPRLERYNGSPSMEILGMGKPGVASSGQAIAIVEKLAARLPAGIGFEWTGLSRQEQASGSQAPLLYAISLLVVFLCLAALYESWLIPVAVVLVIPLGILGTVIAALLGFHMNDVYFQVGLLTTVGLAAKNAILIVEFAKNLHAEGKGIVEAALEAARQRLRPILMTSMAFILGVLPLAIGSGAGAGAQNALGAAVIGGMTSATLLAIFFVPVFFVIVATWTERRSKSNAAEPDAKPDGPAMPATPVVHGG